MLTADSRARIAVVLVGARNPANIGAAARAMQDFGFSDLRFVNEYGVPLEAAQLEAATSAVAAQHVLQAARAFDGIAEAIADCTLVVGTTAIGGRTLTQPVRPLAEVASEMLEVVAGNEGRVALLFGSEKTGLTNEQLSHCTALTTIPMYEPLAGDGTPQRHLSMNLGQSVAVCLYELTRAGFEGAKAVPVSSESAATAEDRERLTQLLLDVMHVTEYSRRFPANAQDPLVRQLAQTLGPTHTQAETWMGILRQVLWHSRQK